jgi:hypothetical protein
VLAIISGFLAKAGLGKNSTTLTTLLTTLLHTTLHYYTLHYTSTRDTALPYPNLQYTHTYTTFLQGGSGALRVGAFVALLIGGILSIASFGIFMGSFSFFFGSLGLNTYGRVMMAITFLTFAAALATAILTLIARD